MLLIIDNFDSFTFNLVDYFKQLGKTVEVIRNNKGGDSIHWEKYEGIVLSPGPGKPQDANLLLDLLSTIPKNKPVLGICLGHQAIGQQESAALTRAIKPMHGKLSEVTTVEDPIFMEIPTTFEVVRYHSLILKDLPESLRAICHTKEGEIMAMAHKNLPIYGIQFHPESVLTQYGMKLLENWLILNNIQAGRTA